MNNTPYRAPSIRAILSALLLACLFSSSGSPLVAQSGWYSVTSGTTSTLNRISWAPGNTFVGHPGLYQIVGDSGTFLGSADAGFSWTKSPDVPTLADLNDLSFPYPDTGYIAGDSGLFRVTYDGEHYHFAGTGPGGRMNAVTSIPGTVSGFAAGNNGTILRTVNRGLSWTLQNSRTTKNINSIRMATVVRIFACGDSGLILRSVSSGTWAALPIGTAHQSTVFNAIEVAGAFGDTAWVVGDNGSILQSRNTGATIPTWFAETSGVTAHLRSIRYHQGALWAVGDSGVILKSVDGGHGWTRQESGTTVNLRDILFADPLHGIVVGEKGTVLRTTTGGDYRPLSASPGYLRFGKVVNGTTRNGILTVGNSGTLPIVITLVATTSPRFTVEFPPVTIPAFGTRAFTVEYSPSGGGEDTASILIQGDNGAFEFRIPASGEGVDSLPQPAWRWLNPRAQGNPLTDIAFFDPDNGIAVGDAGTIVSTNDGGQSWNTIHYAAGINASLRALSILDAQSAVAVGDDGLVVHTSDRGAHWSLRPALGPVESLASVSFAGPDTGFSVGRSWQSDGNGATSIYRTLDGGITWSCILPGTDPLGGVTSWELMQVEALSGTAAVAVGRKSLGLSTNAGLILRTTDAGEHWTPITEVLYPPMRAVTFIDQTTGIAVGDYGTILVTTDGGVHWGGNSPVTSADLVDVSFSGPGSGIALGSDGTVLSSADGGVTWTVMPQTIPIFWTAAAVAGPGLAFGLNGAESIYATTDAGATWKSRSTSVESDPLISVSFKDASNGIAIGIWGDILKTADGGATWTALSGGTLLPYIRQYLSSASYVQPDDITVVGNYGLIVRSVDGGATWTEQSGGTTELLSDVSFAGPEIGYIVGAYGTILRTTDGGDHWHSQATSSTTHFSAVETIDESGAIIVGDQGTILRTTDGGLNWHSRPSGTTQGLEDVDFAGESGVAVGGGGTVLVTTDGGESWSPKDAGTMNHLSGVSLSETGFGTAVGTSGTMLRTTDAGMTWASIPSGTNIRLTDVAFVDDFIGTVVGDHGVMLRTTTGGIPPGTLSDVAVPPLPGWYRLDQNYPNPFNPVTTIRYRLPVESKVVLRVFDILGRVVGTLVDAVQQPGEQRAVWDARGVSSGVYIYRIEATPAGRTGAPFTRDIRMVLVR